MSVRIPPRCVCCGVPLATSAGFHIRIRLGSLRLRMSWCGVCGLTDDIHVKVADADAAFCRATESDARWAAESTMCNLYHDIRERIATTYEEPKRSRILEAMLNP